MSTLDLPIETSSLTLRRYQKTDLDHLARFYLLPEAQRYVELKARDRAELQGVLEAMRHQTRLNRPGDCIALAVVRHSDERLIGHTCLKWTDATASQAELCFAFDPEHRKPGEVTEALRSMLNLGFEEQGLHRIFARCAAPSQPSVRLLKGLGMRLEAHYREHALFQGEWDEELHFAILDREWLRGTKVKELSRHMVA